MRHGTWLYLALLLFAVATPIAGGSVRSPQNGQLFYTPETNSTVKGTYVNVDGTGKSVPFVRHRHGVRTYVDPGVSLDDTGWPGPPAAFSPDAKHLVVQCLVRLKHGKYFDSVSRKDTRWGLCVETAGGKHRRVLTRPPRHTYLGDTDPAWSRDGEKIAYVRTTVKNNDVPPAYNIWVVDANGKNPHAVPVPAVCRDTFGSTPPQDVWPSWGPGEELLYYCSMGIASQVMFAPNPNTVAVSMGCTGLFPQFSQDGTRVLVEIQPDYLDGNVFYATFRGTARADDGIGDPSNLSDPTGDQEHCDWQGVGPPEPDCASQGTVTWSPDSTEIAFIIDRSCDGSGYRDLYVSRLDGSGVVRVAHLTGPRLAEQIFTLAWLPAG
jgi:hypothetical protein